MALEYWTYRYPEVLVALLLAALSIALIGVACLYRQLHRQNDARQAMVDKLQESEDRLRAIIESEPECVKLQTEDGTLLEVNPAGLLLMDAGNADEVVGISIYNTVAPEFIDFYKEQVRLVFSGEAVVFEFKAITLRGREAWLETHAVPLRDARGRITAFLGVTRDNTGRKKAEEQARRHQAELAHVARLSIMGEMATGIAHEVNQPLAAIANFARGGVRRLRSGDTSLTEILSVLDEIGTQAERAGEVLRHVRDFTRKGDSLPQRVHINQLVCAVFRLTELETRQHAASIAMELGVDLPQVEVDPIMVEQVLCNLVRNAAEAMAQHDSPVREIVVTTRTNDAQDIEVLTRDSGPGMNKAVAERAFDQFFSTKPDGTGMGLSISRSIIEAYGGRLWMETAPGAGTVFGFSLPAAGFMEEAG